jgi:hypothetical protein
MTRRVTVSLTDDEYAAVQELAHITEWPIREMISALLIIEVKNQLDHLDIDTPLTLLDVQTVGNA